MQKIRKIFFIFFFMFFMLIGNEYKCYLYLNNYTSSLLPLQSYILYCFNAQKTEKYTNVYICCLAARIIKLLFCLFAQGFSSKLIWRLYHCRWRAVNFDLCSKLMAIEQWPFLSVLFRVEVKINTLKEPIHWTLTVKISKLKKEKSKNIIPF